MPFFAKAQLSSATRFTYYADVFEESPHQAIATEESPFRYPFHLSWEIVTFTAFWTKIWTLTRRLQQLEKLDFCNGGFCRLNIRKTRKNNKNYCSARLRWFSIRQKSVRSILNSNQLPELLEVTSLNKKLFLYFVFFFVVVASSFETLSFQVLCDWSQKVGESFIQAR